MDDLTKINCPKCNALQSFKPRFGKTDDKHYMRKYIRCTKCKSEWDLTPVSESELRKERKVASRKHRSQET
jgi:hypothetical protein